MLFNAININIAHHHTNQHKYRDLLEPNTIITNKNKDNTFKKTPPHI